MIAGMELVVGRDKGGGLLRLCLGSLSAKASQVGAEACVTCPCLSTDTVHSFCCVLRPRVIG